ncbi:hypothetical protein ERJ75_001014000 [Trypanosoma vivax]|uniref:EF-hand domain-containing protein n=1 Tax=Trypanosoma vivax (strain Y486) TaxID=1055687 RepID=G0U270_TRYVY|nr:hypothetical protein TRVL_07222 [Trypanosoma vivax]KAH8611255.1 hypothetical protein ERJ75_001014000 [Trypanosoma vivax]CCC50373.1 conserved hypothetical protein [Trypanosoma vivax Y486]
MLYSDNNNPREDSVLSRVRRLVRTRDRGHRMSTTTGPNSVVDLLRKFRCLEREQHALGEKGVSHEQFIGLLEECGDKLQESDARYLCAAFDGGDGSISSDHFIRHFVGLNRRRYKAVLRAWEVVPKDHEGIARRESMNERYAGSGTRTDFGASFAVDLPEGIGKKSEGAKSGGAAVDLEEFLAYYGGVSANYSLDEDFELFMLREWAADVPKAPIMNETLREWGPSGDPLDVPGPLYVQSALKTALAVPSQNYNYEYMKRAHPYVAPLPPLNLPYVSTIKSTHRPFTEEEYRMANALNHR